MKRDVDLVRQLLLDIEQHGCECTLDSLRSTATHEADERKRYHLRLCIDAGLVKEIDRSATGAPCVRLTNAGHEFLEVCRSDQRWQAAKAVVREQTGGQSLAVLRAVLTKWALQCISRAERYRRWRRLYRPQYVPDVYAEPMLGDPPYRVDSFRYEREPYFDDDLLRPVRSRREYRDGFGQLDGFDREAHQADDACVEEPLGVSLPIHII